MGVSTNAILGYGIHFPEDEHPWRDFDCEEDQAESWLKYKLGEEDAAKCPLTIVWHCYYDYPMYALLVKESITKAYRGYPQEVGLPDEEVLYSWEITLREWLSKLDIPAQPGHLWLMSYWG